nr:MAG TPA: hypothetical protein [Caudoviricetes sp.]
MHIANSLGNARKLFTSSINASIIDSIEGNKEPSPLKFSGLAKNMLL